MRCRACDKNLSDYESTRKFASHGEFVDLCNHCFSYIKEYTPVVENETLNTQEDVNGDDVFEYNP